MIIVIITTRTQWVNKEIIVYDNNRDYLASDSHRDIKAEMISHSAHASLVTPAGLQALRVYYTK